MKALASLLLLLLSLAGAARAYEFKLYAAFIENTRVELSDGAVWMMDKGDVFPVVAYKDMQKSVILQLAGATFRTPTERVRIIKPDEVPAGIEKYRANVRSYLESTSKKMEQKLKDMTAKPAEAPKAEEKKAEEPKPAAEEQKP